MSLSVSVSRISVSDAGEPSAVNYKRIAHVIGAISLLAFTAMLASIYFTPAFVPDEIAFFVWSSGELEHSRSLGPVAPIARYNLAGYGAAYWTLYVNLIDVFGKNAIWIMRSIAFLAGVSIPMALVLVGNRVRDLFGWLLALLWLSMPIALWCGKVTGPEILSVALLVHGNLLLFLSAQPTATEPKHRRRMRAGGIFLIGFAVGLKATMMPAAIFAVAVSYVPSHKTELLSGRSLLGFAYQTGWPLAAGFVLCNPLTLFNFPEFMHQLHAEPVPTALSWQTAQAAISNTAWGWDGVFSGGLLQWGLVPAAMIILSIALLATHIQAFAGLALSFLACWGMIIFKGVLLGWYWFGWIPLIVMAVLWAGRASSSKPWFAWVIALIVVINASTTFSSIAERIAMKAWHLRALEELPQLQEAIASITQGRTYDLIIDDAEVSHNGGLSFDRSAAAELVQMSPPAIKNLSPNWPQCAVAYTKEMHDRATRAVVADAFLRLCQLGEQGTHGRNVLIVVSKRLSSKQHFADFTKYLTHEVIPRSPSGTTFSCLADLPSTTIFEVTTPRHVESAQTGGDQPDRR